MGATLKKVFCSDWCKSKACIEEALAEFNNQKEKGFARSIDEYYFRLALDELLTNAIVHGNNCNKQKRIFLEIEFSRKKVRICVGDEGNVGFPFEIPNPTCRELQMKRGGRGLFLLKSLGSLTWDEDHKRIVVELGTI